MRTVLLITLFLGLRSWGQLPDPRLTPGVVTNVPITILTKHGYTASPGVRHVSEKTKREVFIRYFGKVPDKTGDYEIDHLISLEIGGANSVSNLWPQPYNVRMGAREKDKLENRLASLVRKELSVRGPDAASALLAQFQHEITSDWIACYKKQFP